MNYTFDEAVAKLHACVLGANLRKMLNFPFTKTGG